ncbi:unnamed protein product [Ilex paraguariensis]|uniref:INO80 complex subunit B-like conserved region domain-containing protein n=1 Tax=Ilex paraguariensis TaxID=185542 RepID=A0ABC8RM12_9AQUA
MDEFGGPRFDGIVNTIRKKRSQTSRRPKPESLPFPESGDLSPSSSTPPSDDVSKVSSDENTGCDTNSKRKVFNLNQCASRSFPIPRAEGEYPSKKIKNEDRGSDMLHTSVGLGDGVGNENRLKKFKLKVGGVTHTIQTKSSTPSVSGSGSSTKSARSSDAPWPWPKLILQDNFDEDSPILDKKSGLQGIPWMDFSRARFSLGKEDSLMGKMSGKNASERQGEKSDPVRKSKRVPKKRRLDGAFEEDDEIRYLEKLRTSKVALVYKDFEEESSKKQVSLSRVSKGAKYENLEDFGSVRSVKDGRKSTSERVMEDTDYEEDEELLSDREPEGKKKKKKEMDDPSDSPTENKKEMVLTTRQRALMSSKGASSISGVSRIEFPNGLPPAPPRKQKEKLSEVEHQLKKVEAAQRRRMQNEKAARESEAEAIRKILGQDSSRKKREDKIKKRQEELAQEKAANAQMLASNTIRWVMGPTGTVVTFPKEMGLPQIFNPKPCSYPPPREKCVGPSCTNPYKYRDSKSKLPLCSLQCYKAIHEKMQAKTASLELKTVYHRQCLLLIKPPHLACWELAIKSASSALSFGYRASKMRIKQVLVQNIRFA